MHGGSRSWLLNCLVVQSNSTPLVQTYHSRDSLLVCSFDFRTRESVPRVREERNVFGLLRCVVTEDDVGQVKYDEANVDSRSAGSGLVRSGCCHGGVSSRVSCVACPLTRDSRFLSLLLLLRASISVEKSTWSCMLMNVISTYGSHLLWFLCLALRRTSYY